MERFSLRALWLTDLPRNRECGRIVFIKKQHGTGVIDSDGFRPNVGIVLSNEQGQVFWAKRAGKDSWQFPQGGIKRDETPERAMYRELYEETGLTESDVYLMGCTRNWLRYKLPSRYIRKYQDPICIGQKQIWFMLRLTGDENNVKLDCSGTPEFDRWRWVDYWLPLRKVIFFKRDVYRGALEELAPLLFPEEQQPVGGNGC